MFEFGFGAMNGFCSAIVGSLSFFAVAGAPLNAGSDGVPVSGIGTAWAVEAALSTQAAVSAISEPRTFSEDTILRTPSLS